MARIPAPRSVKPASQPERHMQNAAAEEREADLQSVVNHGAQ